MKDRLKIVFKKLKFIEGKNKQSLFEFLTIHDLNTFT